MGCPPLQAISSFDLVAELYIRSGNMALSRSLLVAIMLLVAYPYDIASFTVRQPFQSSAPLLRTPLTTNRWPCQQPLFEQMEEVEEGVVELAETHDTKPTPKVPNVPFISQGEIDPETLNPDLSDPKQARVILYIIISLLPVLFLIPLMLGSRDLIPLEDFPPVSL